MLAEKVKNFIREQSLLKEKESVLVAFSGGADSMCLLHILKSLSYCVSAAHLNHMLRGKESERDQKAVMSFCDTYDIPCFVTSVDISSLAKEEGISEETAGRNERYKFFDRIAKENGITKIATAHNKNDNAETVLMHLIRGSGVAGLAGIPKKRGNIIRPLLDCTREEIEEYCTKHNLPFVTDSTNLLTDYTRNKVRHQLIPHLKEYNSNIFSTLTSLSQLMGADRDYFDSIIPEIVSSETSIPLSKLEKLEDSILYRVILKLSQNAGLSAEFCHIKSFADMIRLGKQGKKLSVPGGLFEISCGTVSAIKKIPEDFCKKLLPGENAKLGDYVFSLSDKVTSPTHLILPADSDIVVRSKCPGDKILIRGMTKKLSDFFIEKKIPASQRPLVPIITVDGEIVLVAGIEKGDKLNEFLHLNNTFVLNISTKEYNNE